MDAEVQPPLPEDDSVVGQTHTQEDDDDDHNKDDGDTNSETNQNGDLPKESRKENENPPPPPQEQSVQKQQVTTPTPSSPASHKRSPSKIVAPPNIATTYIFITRTLHTIVSSKDARRNQDLEKSAQKAIDLLNADPSNLPPPAILLEPLRLACAGNSIENKLSALDCFSKMLSFSLLVDTMPPQEAASTTPAESDTGIVPPPQVPVLDKAINIICECYQTTAYDERVELQIIKALMAGALNENAQVHGKPLIELIRTIYHIFIRSGSNANQLVAQASLQQVVEAIFERVRALLPEPSSSTATNDQSSPSPKTSTRNEEQEGSNNDSATTVERVTLKALDDNGGSAMEEDRPYDDNAASNLDKTVSANQLCINDAYLAYRALCKLTLKQLDTESQNDIKSSGMRSKLISLRMVFLLLENYRDVFASEAIHIKHRDSDEETVFVRAISPFICACLARNAASPVIPVFELCCEIFWIAVSELRDHLKQEVAVFLNEIYLPILEMKTSPPAQKMHLLRILKRICADPKCLVEIYLNYDCDQSQSNVYEKLVDYCSKIATTQVSITSQQKQAFQQQYQVQDPSYRKPLSLPSLSVQAIANANFSHNEYPYPTEYILKHDALETMIAILNTLSSWADQASATAAATASAPETTTTAATIEGQASSSSTNIDGELTPQSSRSLSTATLSPSLDSSMTKFSGGGTAKRESNPLLDDPTQFESLKHTKTVLTEGIRKFNFKPSRGIKALIDNGFIKSKSPVDIASFLLATPGIDKNVFGEFIGEGNDENIEIMHAVVDNIDFKNMDFLNALRKLLRAFRLPGEAQKIDRILLKFAEHYYSQNPDAPFANGDTVYVLAYSVIMLNTDLHNPGVRIKMTTEDFIKNNRGINDNGDLPREFLLAIYDNVRDNEFILYDHQRVESTESGGYGLTSISNILSSFGRDIQREAYLQVSRDMSTKTEAMFKDIAGNKSSRTKISNVFYVASHAEHAGPMFEVGWMSFLGGLSGLMQESDDISIAHICMGGIKTAIHLSCLFDIEYARISFVAALAAFTNLQNLNELKLKNVEAIKTLLEVALSEGNFLKSSWKDVLTCISQLERFQLISSGINEGSVPDVTMARIARRRSSESTTRSSRQSFSWSRTTRMLTNSGSSNSGTGIGSGGGGGGNNSNSGGSTLFGLHNNSVPKFAEDVAMESKSSEIEVLMDRIFTQSASLNGDAIIFFVKALTQVSWEEIESSGQSDSPRMFSLQKMVDVSYYNMNRIRVEWSNLWSIMGEQFNQVGCHSNINVVFFALDSLRQLSMRFLELEELPHFKFQKDFLRPFEHVIMNNPSIPVKDMVIACLHQMILAKADKIKSGWRTMFGTFASAAKEHNQQLVNTTFQVVSLVHRDHLSEIIAQGSFADMIVSLTALSKNHWYQKPSLHAIELLKSSINAIMENPECPLSPKFKHPKTSQQQSPDDAMIKFWFPILFAFHDIIMTGEDLEVRSRALNYFFDTLVQYGNSFSPEFWDTVCRQLLFPIFVVLKSKSDVTKFNSKEDMSVWLSTTMIQALRNFIALFSFYFDILEKMMDTFLDLLVSCICQENETLAHLGTSCLLQLVNDNYSKFQKKHWAKIVNTFRTLFQITSATQLFNGRNRHVSNGSTTNGENNNRSLQQVSKDQNGVEAASAGSAPGAVSAARRREFATIIVKCVLQLLMIDTLRELLTSKNVYNSMPCDDMLTLLGLLMDSFLFARKFNNDKDLRVALWHEGFMRQLPNLLMQESKAASTRVAILFDMYCDESAEKQAVRDKVETMLIEIIIDILEGYTALETGTQQRNIAAWHPVVVDILTRYTALSSSDYGRHIDAIYPVTIDLLDRDLDRDLRSVLKSFLVKAGDVLMKGKSKG